jgi:PHD/YefM family antitoxin component YafN of YafNO toxin-antitoxin module
VTITTVSSREFDQDASGARRAASKGPVIIKDRGRPSHVLLTIDAYQNLTQKTGTIADLLAMPGVADIAFETPRTGNMARPADLSQLMFVLDTNVVSELRKAKAGKADRHMAAWASGVPAEVLFVSAITIRELETGVLLVHRRDPRQGAMLRTWLDQYVLPAF